MDRQELKRLLAGLGIAGLLAGSSLMAAGCAANRAPGSGCGGPSGCGGMMKKAPQTTTDDAAPSAPQGSGSNSKL